MKEKWFIIITITVSICLLLASFSAAKSSDFYAYYTRLDYDIPIELATDYIPQELDEESREILARMRALEGEEEDEDEEEEEEWRTSGPITGKYADIIVNLAAGRQLVFARESSYLPYWETEKGKWFIKEIVPRQKDIACLYSYVRIIENKPDKVLIHWRYMPRLRKVGPADVVHEYFDITPDERIVRRIKKGTREFEKWNDPQNVTVQTIKLVPEGIKEISLETATLGRRAKEPVAGSPVKTKVVGSPAAWWKFDEGLKQRTYGQNDLAKESVGGRDCSIVGEAILWKKGVSGTALAFDGYRSKVMFRGSEAPSIGDELTVEAWVVLGAYPWNWAPLVHQSIVDPGPIERGTYDEHGRGEQRKKGEGYYLGVGPYGYPIFTIDGRQVEGSVKLSTYRWTHIAGTYGDGRMRIYVDGEECGSIEAAGKISVPNTGLVIGLNNIKGRATDPVRGPICHLPLTYGIEGLIDEVKIYNIALNSSQVAASYKNLRPTEGRRDSPDLQRRILPGRPGATKKFGAEYTELRYHELWDNLWRTGGYPDVIVKFDSMPTSIVFWRGVNGGAGWVTENNKWMSDQSIETGGPHGCSEHMADKQCRHAHVRVIENTDARVVVHWRYASIDVGYLFPEIRHWTDEYYYIYPDCAAVRKVRFRNGNAGWHDVQFLSQPGTTCLDNIHRRALSVANLKGEVRSLVWGGKNQVPRNRLRDACISMVNLKSKYKVFLVYPERVRIGTWGRNEQSPHTDDPFAGPWNHWPVSQIPSDGRYAVAEDRLTHAALGGAGNVTRYGNMIIYGLTDEPITSLVPLAKSWNHPPAVTDVKGCTSQGYSKEQRAYQLTAKASKLSFTLEASENSPVANPCFVIKNWDGGTTKVGMQINTKSIPSGKDFRQGIIRDTDGTPTMVIWLKTQSTEPLQISIIRLENG
jgi:hypothetical protein